MRIVIAPDKFKGSLTAWEAARAIEDGLADVLSDVETRILPVADGGEGTSEVIANALDGVWVDVEVKDPLGRLVKASYAWVDSEKAQDLAVLEMSVASGLWRLDTDERDPLRANTYGTGQMLLDAIGRGARSVIVGIGGSATNDGGFGMATALGYAFSDEAGRCLTSEPGNLSKIARVERRSVPELPEIVIASDVRNPLFGERGATRVYGPQKGVTPEMMPVLESGLKNLADVVARDLGCDFRDEPGAGAAGGLGFGLLTFCSARIEDGFGLVARTIDLESAVKQADLVVTGEGKLDSQTLEGKAPAGVAALARKTGIPVVALGGTRDGSDFSGFDEVIAITDGGLSVEEAIRDAGPLLKECAARLGRKLAERGAQGAG